MEHQMRHRAVWRLFRPLVRLILFFRFNYRCKSFSPKGPCIVVCNHVTDWDPLLVGAAFRRQMYFLASEHIMRLGFVSRLLDWLVHPIVRQKGGSAAGAVKEMLRVLKAGGNVALFPEGNRTWDGVTRDFPASTGKLVKTGGASLVTFRLRGGYLSSPRWSGDTARRQPRHLPPPRRLPLQPALVGRLGAPRRNARRAGEDLHARRAQGHERDADQRRDRSRHPRRRL